MTRKLMKFTMSHTPAAAYTEDETVSKGIGDTSAPTSPAPANSVGLTPFQGSPIATSWSAKPYGLSYDPARMREKLQLLYQYKDVPTRQLSGEALAAHQSIVSNVSLIYMTEEYPAFFELVREIFPEKEPFRVGTVAAYFGGCSIKTSLDRQGCSVLCAGALPLPNSSATDANCQHPVLFGYYDGGKYTFISLYALDNKENTIVFINAPPGSVFGQFAGFTSTEMSQLKAMGVRNVTIYRTSDNGKDYAALTSGFQSLDTLPKRSDNSSAALTAEQAAAGEAANAAWHNPRACPVPPSSASSWPSSLVIALIVLIAVPGTRPWGNGNQNIFLLVS